MKWNDLLIIPIDSDNPPVENISAAIRGWRNRELAASDWTQLPDVDLANKWDWAVYRQSLRDMMAQNEDPKLIVFPEPPK
jgi:hypothetical protein